MDADPVARNLLHHLAHDALDLVREGAAVGVAEHEPACAGLLRSNETRHRIVGIGLVAVEEMLGVEHHLVHAGLRIGERVRDHLEVLVAVDLEGDVDVEVPGLADHADIARLGLQDGGQSGIVGRTAAGAARHAERRELGVLELRRVGEEAIVCRIGARPAAFNVVNPKQVQFARNRGFVGNGEVDTLGLGAVSQGGVEEVDSVGLAHGARIIVTGSYGRYAL